MKYIIHFLLSLILLTSFSFSQSCTSLPITGQYAAGWWHNKDGDNAYQDFHWDNYPDGNTVNPGHTNQVSSLGYESYGWGVNGTIFRTYLTLTDVYANNLPQAKASGDYVQYTFRTTGSITANTYLSKYSFVVGRYNADYYPYDFSIEVSEDGGSFVNTINANHPTYVSQTPGLNDGHQGYAFKPSTYIHMKPNTNYTIRIYVYNAQGVSAGIIKLDDFNFGLESCTPPEPPFVKPNISIDDVSKLEGDSGTTDFSFTVALDKAVSKDVSVHYNTNNGSATTTDSDYLAKSGSITIPAGQTSNTVTIQVNGDTKVEPDETFTIFLSTPTNATIVDDTGLGTILNDDTESSFTISSPTVTEGDSLEFIVALDNVISTDAVIAIEHVPGTATNPEDYGNPSPTTVTIVAGSLSSIVTVATIVDDIYEESEYMTLKGNVTSGNIINASASGKGTIEDNGIKPTVSISDTIALEGTDLVFEINLSGKSSQATTITLSTADNGSAEAGKDYTAIQNITITIPAGEISAQASVKTLTDEIIEGDETMILNGTVTSSNTNNPSANGTGTITDDDYARITISDINLSEGNDGENTPFGFKVSLDQPDIVDITLSYSTSDGNATVADEDYNSTSGTITILAGDTSATIDVNVIGDNKVEQDEDFYVTIAKVSDDNSTIARSIGKGIIENDDNVTITIDDVNLTEGDSGYKDFNFTVTLSSPHTEQIELKYHTEETQFGNDNATADLDYETTKGTLTFKPGEAGSKIVTIRVVGDRIIENNETFNVILELVSNTSDTYLTDDTGLGTIINDDFRTPSTLITFNVERTNTRSMSNNTINSTARNAWYTQVSGRTFAYDVVCYLADLSTEYTPQDMVVKIDLMSNGQSIDTRYAYFNNSSRAKLDGVIVDEASKDARFVVRVPTDGTTIYNKNDCTPDSTAKECYEALLNKVPLSLHSHEAKDNFAIRPAGFKYTIGEEQTPLIDNSTVNDDSVHLAAEHGYRFNATALRYDENNSKIIGYDGATVERNIVFVGNTSCNDTKDRSDTITFQKGVKDEIAFDINQTGKYILKLGDNDWTKVDQNGNDCKANSNKISTGINDIQGCDINSTIKLNTVDYTDQTITVYPHHFQVDLISSSDPENLSVIYMNSITATNTNMSKQVDVNITAKSERDTNLTNFTNGCMAENLTLDINISSPTGLTRIQDTDRINHYLHLAVNDNKNLLLKIENNSTTYSPGVAKSKFEKEDEGIAKIELNYNIDRSSTAPVNPDTITLSTVEVTSPTAYYYITPNAKIAPKGTNTNTIPATFLYARARASQKLYEGLKTIGNVNTQLAIDVYCLDPINNSCRDAGGIPLYGLNTSESSAGWWLATQYINTNQAGTLALVNSNQLNVAISPTKDIKIPSNPDTTDLNASTNALSGNITVDCPTNENDIAEVSLDEVSNPTSPWLVYNNNPLYRVKCSNGSNWAGQGSEGNVLGGVIQRGGAAVDPGNPNNPAPDASAIRKTHRMSW